MPTRLRQLMIACAVIASAHLALNAFYLDVVMHNGVAERTLRQFETLRDATDIVALGDSHMKWGLQASEIPGGFNFALPGESYIQNYYRLESLLDKEGVEIRAVVMAADPHSLSRRGEEHFRHYYAGFVKPLELARVDGAALARVAESLRGRFAPYFGQRTNLLAYFATGRPPEVPWLDSVEMRAGSLASTRSVESYSPAGRRAKAAERLRYHFGQKREVDATLVHYLERILSLCEERGIRLLFVRFPLGDAYLDALGDSAEFDRALATRIAASPAAELLDARGAFRGQTLLFADVDHLNLAGAERLTRRVAMHLAVPPRR